MNLKTTQDERKKLLQQIRGMRFVCCIDSPNMHDGKCFVGRLEAALEDIDAAVEELLALREVAEAARAFLPTCEVTIYQDEHAYQECGAPATHIDRMQGLLCDGHRSAYVLTTPRPLDPDPRVDALRAALDRVPR